MSRLLAVYEMFCLCETCREPGSVLNLLISYVPFGSYHLLHTFASRDSPHMYHYTLFFRFIYSINRHFDSFLNVADRCTTRKEGEGLQGSYRMVGASERQARIWSSEQELSSAKNLA